MSRFNGLDVSEHPRAMALLVCQRVIVDEGTKQKSLIDIYDNVTVSSLPAAIPKIAIYACLSRGTRDMEQICLGLFSPNGETIVKSVLGVTDWGIAGQVDFVISLEMVPITSAGVYDLQLFVAEHVLASRRLVVQIVPQPPEEQADSPTP